MDIMKLSVCIDMMFSYCDFYDRIAEAGKYGIKTIEFWKWSNKDIDRIADSGADISIFNLDSPDEKLSYELSRGILNSGRTEDFLKALTESLPIYKKLHAKAMIVLIGEDAPYHKENVKKCLAAALPVLKAENVNLVVEPLNDIDRKNYAMPYAAPVFDLLKEINDPHIKMLYDIYHQNVMGDFSLAEVRKNIDLIGHFHIADAPGRHEPGTGTVHYTNILKEIAAMPYEGYIGLEYRATKPDGLTFGFLKEAGYFV